MDTVTMDKMTYQELANATQASVALTTQLLHHGVKRVCAAAATDPLAAAVEPPMAKALGLIWQVHGYTTEAANLMPDVVPMFGDK